MLLFGVTIPATVPQRSKIPEGLTNYPVYLFIYLFIYVWGILLTLLCFTKNFFSKPETDVLVMLLKRKGPLLNYVPRKDCWSVFNMYYFSVCLII